MSTVGKNRSQGLGSAGDGGGEGWSGTRDSRGKDPEGQCCLASMRTSKESRAGEEPSRD